MYGCGAEIVITATAAAAGETIATSSRYFWDSIALLLAPDGSPAAISDDEDTYFAAFEYVAETTGTCRLRVTSFESVGTGALIVMRDLPTDARGQWSSVGDVVSPDR